MCKKSRFRKLKRILRRQEASEARILSKFNEIARKPKLPSKNRLKLQDLQDFSM